MNEEKNIDNKEFEEQEVDKELLEQDVDASDLESLDEEEETNNDETSALNNKWITWISVALVAVAAIAIVIVALLKSGSITDTTNTGELIVYDKTTSNTTEGVSKTETTPVEETTVVETESETNQPQTGTQEETESETESETQKKEYVAGDKLNVDDYAGLTDAVKNYYSALQGSFIMELVSLTDFKTNASFNPNDLLKINDIIDSINVDSFELYKGTENYYIVYAKSYICFKNVSTPAPSLARFIVIDRGSAYAFRNGDLDEAMYELVNKIDEYSDIVSLKESVNEELNEARKENETLDKLFDLLSE